MSFTKLIKIIPDRLVYRMRGIAGDKEAYNKYVATLDGKLDAYERILSKQKYMAGNVSKILAFQEGLWTPK